MALAQIITVRDGYAKDAQVIARFTFSDDAVFFCKEMSHREPDRVMVLTDRAGFYNEYYGPLNPGGTKL